MIGPCERFEELWLDYLYGLCAEDQSRELEAHLPLCPTCQGALAEAKACQQRLALAARAVAVVPEFTQPRDEPAPLSLVTELSKADASKADASKPRDERRESSGSTPAPVLQLRPRRSLARQLWPVWSAAAALLIAVVGAGAWHRQGLGQRDQAVAQAKREVLAIEARLAQLHKDAERAQQTLQAEADVEPVRVEVVGPAATQPGAPFTANVTTRGPGGQPQSAELDVKVFRDGEVIHREKLASRGAAQVTVPGGWKAAANLRLDVLAKRADESPVAVRESVQVQPVNHVLHLALNKAVFEPGEVIFMRALALERYSLRPAQKPLTLTFALLDGQGRDTFHTAAATGAGGIASAGLAVVPTLPPGQYTVQVAGPDLAPQRRAVEIVPRLNNVEVFADRDGYRGGEQMKLTVDVRAPDGRPVPNQAVEVRSSVAGGRAAMPPPVTARTDAGGRAKVDVPLPPTLDGAQVDVEVQARGFMSGFGGGGGPGAPAAPGGLGAGAGKKKEAAGAFAAAEGLQSAASVRRSFQVIPSRLDIDFYPEGGDLLAGVEQRIYYRVRSPLGEPVRPEGRVVVLAGKDVVYTSEPGQGIGVFRLNPDPKQRYAVRIAGPMSVTEIRDPFKGLGIQTDGIALAAADSVVAAGAPLAVDVHNRGPARQLALVVQCRGQVVTQKIVDATTSPVKAGLALPAEVAGVLRVTAYELRDGRLEPRAERLVYRAPARKLDLKVAVQTRQADGKDGKDAAKDAAKGAVKSANNATLGIEARNETGQLAPAWTAAVVAEDRHRAEANELSLAQHFLIAQELGADADVNVLAGLAGDNPQARTTLDLLLGVHGWRRFVPRQQPVQLAARENATRDANEDRAGASQSPAVALFHRESGAEPRTRAEAKQRAQAAVAALKQRTDETATELHEERTAAAAVLAAAHEARDAYAQLPGEYYRLGLGLLAAAAFGAACLLMLWGLVRAARRRGAAAPPFAGAIAAFAVCLALYIGLGSGVRIEEPGPKAQDQAVAILKKKEAAKDAQQTAARPAQAPKGAAPTNEQERSEMKRPAERTEAVPRPDAAPKSEGADPTAASRAPAPAKTAASAPHAPKAAPNPLAQGDNADARAADADKAVAQRAGAERAAQPAQQNAFRRDQARGMLLSNLEELDRARGGNVPGRATPGGSAGYAADPALVGRYARAFGQQKMNLDALRTVPMNAAAKKGAPGVPAAPTAPRDAPAAPPALVPGVPNILMESAEVAREFAYRRGSGTPNPPTLLWHPALRLESGRAKLDFDLPPAPATYRILIYGHTDDGRLGFFEDRLNTVK